jgi:heme-degrading monooxygenase HmoA
LELSGWGRNLIVRVLRGRVHPGQVPTFREQAQHALHDARQHDGLVYAQIGRQAHVDGGEEIIFVSVWRNLEALYKWVGGLDLLDTPVLDGNNPDVFEHFEVQHYETYESADPESPDGEEPLSTAARGDARS